MSTNILFRRSPAVLAKHPGSTKYYDTDLLYSFVWRPLSLAISSFRYVKLPLPPETKPSTLLQLFYSLLSLAFQIDLTSK